MNSKLIVVGTISAAVGAVVSWAVTADYYDNKIKEAAAQLEENIEALDNLRDEVREMRLGNQVRDTGLDKSTLTDELVFATPEEATDVLDRLKEILEAHDVVTRGDLFAMLGLASSFPDTQVGWINLEQASVVAHGGMIKLILPPIEVLDWALDADEKKETSTEAVITSPEPIDEVGADEGQEDEHGVRPVNEPDEEYKDVIPPGETPEETRANLANIINEYVANPDDVDEFVGNVVKVEALKNEAPFIISREEYAYSEHYDHYEKTTLTYYPKQRVVLDEDEEVVEEVAYVVGWKNLSRDAWGGESGNPDTVFVRNPKMETDFEIVREEDGTPPVHVLYGMDKETYRIQEAAGVLKPPRTRFHPED